MSKFDKLYKKHTSDKDHALLKIELADIFQACFDEYPDLILLGVVGHTPSFNDGDICSHYDNSFALTKDEVYDNSYYIECAIENIQEHISGMNASDKADYLDDDAAISTEFEIGGEDKANFSIPKSIDLENIKSANVGNNETIKKVLRLLVQQDVTKDLYETNYVVTARITNGKLEIEQDDYWPSY